MPLFVYDFKGFRQWKNMQFGQYCHCSSTCFGSRAATLRGKYGEEWDKTLLISYAFYGSRDLLEDLLMNALRYTRSDATIIVHIGAKERHQDSRYVSDVQAEEISQWCADIIDSVSGTARCEGRVTINPSQVRVKSKTDGQNIDSAHITNITMAVAD